MAASARSRRPTTSLNQWCFRMPRIETKVLPPEVRPDDTAVRSELHDDGDDEGPALRLPAQESLQLGVDPRLEQPLVGTLLGGRLPHRLGHGPSRLAEEPLVRELGNEAAG